MSANEKSQSPKPASASTKDVGQKQLQQAADEVAEKGYFGSVPDPTPNHAYTVAGVLKGEPTPETDDKAYEAANKAVRRV